jgi:TusA-related sulfurtransferase
VEKKKNIITMDIRGQICPSCLLLVLKEVNSHIDAIRAHQCELAILSDDRHAMITIPESISKMGLSSEVESKAHGFEIRIFKDM